MTARLEFGEKFKRIARGFVTGKDKSKFLTEQGATERERGGGGRLAEDEPKSFETLSFLSAVPISTPLVIASGKTFLIRLPVERPDLLLPPPPVSLAGLATRKSLA